MTRINVIPPAELLDQHLLAEYRELPRVFALARPLRPGEQVQAYTLGRGHVLFFYDKLEWLAARQAALIAECEARGFQVVHKNIPSLGKHPPELRGTWSPGRAACLTNLARLADRQSKRPGFYRLRGETAPDDHYARLLLGREAA